MSKLEKSSMHLIHIYINCLQLFTNFAFYRLFTPQLHSYDVKNMS